MTKLKNNSIIDKAIKANEFIDDLKSAILGSVVITIRDEDTNELLWSCATDECYGKFKEININLEIDQDIKLHDVLEQLKIILDREENA